MWTEVLAVAVLLFFAAVGAMIVVEWVIAKADERERRKRNQAHPWRKHHW